MPSNPPAARRPLIQIALDFLTIEQAIANARLGIQAGVDILEVGTPPTIDHSSPVPAHAMHPRKLRRSILDMLSLTKEGWAMQKKYIVRLTDAEREALTGLLKRQRFSAQKVRRGAWA